MHFPAEKCGFRGAHGRKPQEIAGGLQGSSIKNASQLSQDHCGTDVPINASAYRVALGPTLVEVFDNWLANLHDELRNGSVEGIVHDVRDKVHELFGLVLGFW